MSTRSLMQVISIKFAVLLFASAAALTLPNTLPAQSFPQWITLKGEEGILIYNFNSVKALPNGIKQVDTYFPNLKKTVVTYVSCPKWRYTPEGYANWAIIPPDTLIEVLAYKLCGGG